MVEIRFDLGFFITVRDKFWTLGSISPGTTVQYSGMIISATQFISWFVNALLSVYILSISSL